MLLYVTIFRINPKNDSISCSRLSYYSCYVGENNSRGKDASIRNHESIMRNEKIIITTLEQHHTMEILSLDWETRERGINILTLNSTQIFGLT